MAHDVADQTETRERFRPNGWTQQQSVLVYRIAQLLSALLFRVVIRHFRIIGAEKVPAQGGMFLIANHTTGLDPFLLAYPVKQRLVRGPGRIELFENPFWGFLMRKLGMFPLRQGVADAAAVRTMMELYRHGRLVAVFPEGGRSRTGELDPFNPDFARLVIKLKAPLVPAAVAGGRELLPVGKLIPRWHSPVVVVYGEVFDLSQFYGQERSREALQQAADLMQERVAALLEIARAERARLPGGQS